MFKNKSVKKAEFELRMLFLALATVFFVFSITSALELRTLGYWIATVLSACTIVKLVRDGNVWAAKNINFDGKNPAG